MELTAQSIHSLFCVIVDTCLIDILSYLCHWFALGDLQTGKVIKSVIPGKAFAIFPLWKFRAETSIYLEFQTLLLFTPLPSLLPSPKFHLWYGMDIFWNHPISCLDYHRETNQQHVAKSQRKKSTCITTEPFTRSSKF